MPRTNWTEVHAPALATQATITRAAGAAGVRHYCQKLQATLGAAAMPADAINVHVRDGAAGAGAILWSGALSAPAAGSNVLSASFDPPIMGTAATQMTVEFAAAGPAGSAETVNAQGFDL